MRRILVLLTGLTLLLGAGGARAATGAPAIVVIAVESYRPVTVTVHHGGKVTFLNADAATLTFHTASYPVGCTPGTCVWTTPLLTIGKPSAQVKITLPPGTYTFYCRIHTFMRGRVKVT